MASRTPNPEQQPESYSKMSVGDVEAIGAHCQMAFCHQLDFLPFRCESCKGKFCLDHRTETAHNCPEAGAWARRRREAQPPSTSSTTSKPNILDHDQQCSSPTCKTLVNTALTPGVHCQTCNRMYCLKHRMKEDHDCKNLTPLGARPLGGLQAQRERGMAALDKLRAWGAAKKTSTGSSSSSSKSSSSKTFSIPVLGSSSSSRPKKESPITALNNLKKTAKGDEKIPMDKRIYLHVEASADTTTAKYPSGNFWYNKDFTVGRVLDIAAKALQVQNVNNRGGGEEQRLRIFHVEAGRLLDFPEKLGDAVKSGNTIVLLRGVGPPIPDLIEA